MTPSKRIEELNAQIEAERRKIANCKHTFGKAIYDPEKYMKGYGSVQDGAGSDPHWSYAGYTEAEKPRWSRTCTECGHIEYAYDQKPVITSYEPNFK
jgi:hypothetical protein